MLSEKNNSSALLPSNPVGGTLLSEHAYKLVRRIEQNCLFTVYEAHEEPFDRKIWLRLYRPFETCGLSDEAITRIRGVLQSAGDVTGYLDLGEIGEGQLFLVMRPPRGVPLASWWDGKTERLIKLAKTLCKWVPSLPRSSAVELSLGRIYLYESADGEFELTLGTIGEMPTRHEIREMTQAYDRDLVLSFTPEELTLSREVEPTQLMPTKQDVFRVGAVLYELVGGSHPLLPQDCDLTEVIKELINDLFLSPEPVDSGIKSLDEIICNAVQISDERRLGWAAFEHAVNSLGERKSVAQEVADEETERELENPAANVIMSSWKKSLMVCVVLLVLFTTYLFKSWAPVVTDLIITSEPAAIQFEQIMPDGSTVPLGRTPILMQSTPLEREVMVRPVYEEGVSGEIYSLDLRHLNEIDSCRYQHFIVDGDREQVTRPDQ